MTSEITDTMPRSLDSVSSPHSHRGETVVLLITTHGTFYTVDEYQQDVTYFDLPSDTTLKRVLVSTPGVCNLLSDSDTDRFAKMISESMNGLLNDNNETQDQTIKEILDSIEKYDMSTLHETQIEFKKLKQKQKQTNGNISEENTSLLEDYENYLRHFDNSFNFNIFKSGEHVADKFYTRDDLEAGGNNWVIKVIGSSKPELQGMDLMTHLSPPTEESNDSSITLEEIVDFLKKEHNVETIIIFDFSCSVILTEDFKKPSDRATRRFRRNFIQLTEGSRKGSREKKLTMGGKTKKRRIVKKNKKNKNKTKRRKCRKCRK